MCHYVGAKWLSWVVCVCVYVGWVLLAVQVWKCVGGERCVDLETQEEGKKSTPKGREAEVTSTVQQKDAQMHVYNEHFPRNLVQESSTLHKSLESSGQGH